MGGVRLGANRYGKAAVRLVRVERGAGAGADDRHTITDLTVRTALAGDLAATHLTGDNSGVLPTDTQKNAVYALAAEHGVGEPEEFALRLGRYLLDAAPTVTWARVVVERHGWRRVDLPAGPAPHSFERDGAETRRTQVTTTGDRTWVVSGLTGLVLMNTAGSEFAGFLRDRYTTLAETSDRILATAVDAWWRYTDQSAHLDWGAEHAEARRHLVEAFADTYSRSLQQTLYAMGSRLLAHRPAVADVRLSLPNRHHLPVDLTPFGLPDRNEVFVATDAPYGLIEAEVLRDHAAPVDEAW